MLGTPVLVTQQTARIAGRFLLAANAAARAVPICATWRDDRPPGRYFWCLLESRPLPGAAELERRLDGGTVDWLFLACRRLAEWACREVKPK